jgi:NADPH2:quinone reductase
MRDEERVQRLGADAVFVVGERTAQEILAVAPGGVDRIVEVALDANAELDAAVAAQGAVIVAYATQDPEPRLPFWPMLFQNVVLRLIGSDDFPAEAKQEAVADIADAVAEGGLVPDVGLRVPLERIADAHQAVEDHSVRGRVLVEVSGSARSGG